MQEISPKDIENIIYINKRSDYNIDLITQSLQKLFEENFQQKAVLGFDIYRYSQYPPLQQSLIPYLFKELYHLTIKNCLSHEDLFFQHKKNEDFINYFLDSGDGGFQIFDTPIHAVVFAIYFQANIKRYNSGFIPAGYIPKIFGEITLRYALTYDSIYYYSKNYYGSAIINNARMMAKDRLNRFLLDENSITWFTETINGIENLQVIDFNDLTNLKLFNQNVGNEKPEEQTRLFGSPRSQILRTDLLKIGEIKSKHDTLSIYNLHIQARMTSSNQTSLKKYVIALGNLNSSGLTE